MSRLTPSSTNIWSKSGYFHETRGNYEFVNWKTNKSNHKVNHSQFFNFLYSDHVECLSVKWFGTTEIVLIGVLGS